MVKLKVVAGLVRIVKLAGHHIPSAFSMVSHGVGIERALLSSSSKGCVLMATAKLNYLSEAPPSDATTLRMRTYT